MVTRDVSYAPQTVRPFCRSDINMRNQSIVAEMRGQLTPITTSNIANTYAAYSFAINSMGSVADFTSLFDEYRVERVDVWLEPGFTSTTPAAPENGTMVSAIDIDDAATPSSYTNVASYPGAQDSTLPACHAHSWVPTASSAMYSGAFTSYSNVVSPWCDTNSPSIQHFGLKVAISQTTTNALNIRVIVRMRVRFRGMRPA